ncbi:GDSL-type esterase/lipase family protein [Pseudalkalibacillus sp. SCS-8]|uniref:GDSL-type esterase/lipase family protein n=1 Tax=Pseudalkalibacillus nanhaiensis TaxID=3115291 RepID=UPI0032DBA720
MEAKPLKYVAIGDSLTLGIGSMFRPDFVTLYMQSLEAACNRKVEKSTFAKNGATTAKILRLCEKRKVIKAIKEADVITITAGGNDLKKVARKYMTSKDHTIIKRAIERSINNIHKLLQEIKFIKKGQTKPYFIRIVGLYNPYPKLEFSEKWIRLFNSKVKKVETEHIKVVDIFDVFKSEGRRVLSFDGLHPNKDGYKMIAEALDKKGYLPLTDENLRNEPFPYQKS